VVGSCLMYLCHSSVRSTKKITDPSTAVNGKFMCVLVLETNPKGLITIIFGSNIF
jgi:hypothetical protein